MEKLLELIRNSSKLDVGGASLEFDHGDLDGYHSEKAERELRETPERVQESFKVLSDMLAEEEDLYIIEDQEYLNRFLRPCKWYPKSAFKLITRYYQYRQNHPEVYKDLYPSGEKAVFSSGILTPLPRRTADGVRVVIVQAGHRWNPKEVSLYQIFRAVLMILELAVNEPKTQVSGVRVIVDMEGLTLSHVSYFTPSFASAVIEFVSRSLPCRLKGVHIVNQSFIFDMVFAFFKPFLQGKLKDRIYFHGVDAPSLLKHFDTKSLPKQYGGEFDLPEGPLGEQLYNYACTFEDYFKEMDRYGYSS